MSCIKRLCEKRRVTFPHQIHGKYPVEVLLQEDHQTTSKDFSLFQRMSAMSSGCLHHLPLSPLPCLGCVPATCPVSASSCPLYHDVQRRGESPRPLLSPQSPQHTSGEEGQRGSELHLLPESPSGSGTTAHFPTTTSVRSRAPPHSAGDLLG